MDVFASQNPKCDMQDENVISIPLIGWMFLQVRNVNGVGSAAN